MKGGKKYRFSLIQEITLKNGISRFCITFSHHITSVLFNCLVCKMLQSSEKTVGRNKWEKVASLSVEHATMKLNQIE